MIVVVELVGHKVGKKQQKNIWQRKRKKKNKETFWMVVSNRISERYNLQQGNGNW